MRHNAFLTGHLPDMFTSMLMAGAEIGMGIDVHAMGVICLAARFWVATRSGIWER